MIQQRFPGAGVLLICLLLAACSEVRQEKDVFEKDREAIVMREVAHRVLLYTGDSSTSIPPVARVSDYLFRISFHSAFRFQPDSLVQVIRRTITGHGMPADYIVQVMEPQTRKVVFGYSISGNEQQDIIPCSGREQPLKQYSIDIRFKEPAPRSVWFRSWILWIAGGVMALGLMIWVRSRNTRFRVAPVQEKKTDETNGTIRLGRMAFNPHQLSLSLEGQQQSLTVKEAKLLGILAESANQVVDRNRLQKEVWEDEGVIVGRSLDMFISRLRKKLEGDDTVKIVSIHGKGYRLEIPETTLQ